MTQLALSVTVRDHARGRLCADVVLVEYGSYESGRCREAHGITTELVRWFGMREFCYVFRHFPPEEDDGYSQLAAEAAEAAGAQGKFWEMHEALFKRRRLSEAALVRSAAEVGLDVEQFSGEIAARKHRGRVLADRAGGIKSGVKDTPTFFINGIKHRGSWDIDTLIDAISWAGDPVPKRAEERVRLNGH